MAAFLATDRTRWLGHAMAVIGVVALVAPERPRARRVRGRAQPRAGHRPRAWSRPTVRSRSMPTTWASCRTTRSRPWWRPCHACRSSRPAAIRRLLVERRTELERSRVRRRRSPGTSVVNARGTRSRRCPDRLTYTPGMAIDLPVAPPIEPMLAKAVDRAARWRRLAVRAQVGRLPRASCSATATRCTRSRATSSPSTATSPSWPIRCGPPCRNAASSTARSSSPATGRSISRRCSCASIRPRRA